jgi:hypothetical protein
MNKKVLIVFIVISLFYILGINYTPINTINHLSGHSTESADYLNAFFKSNTLDNILNARYLSLHLVYVSVVALLFLKK